MTETTKPARTKAAYFVFVTLALDAMGIGIIVPVMPDLLRDLSYMSIGEAAKWGGYLSFVYALMQFVFSPLLGAISDRFGRRPILLISVGTLAIDYLIMALAPTLAILFLGRVLAGVAGATYSTGAAYIADVTPKERRSAMFGLVGASFGVGFVLGPAIGGLLGELGPRAPFYAAAALAAMNFLYGWFVLPESLAPENRRPFEWRRANPLGAFRQIMAVPIVAWFLAAQFLYRVSHFVYPAVWSYFTAEAFGWTAAQIGLSLAAVGVGFAIVQGGLIHIVLKRLGEVRTALLGFGLNIVAMVGIALSTKGWMIYALMPLSALGDITAPALSGLMANRIPDDQQGELQGVVASSQAITTIISPLAMTQTFGLFTVGAASSWYFPGAPFILAAGVMALAAVPFIIGLRRR